MGISEQPVDRGFDTFAVPALFPPLDSPTVSVVLDEVLGMDALSFELSEAVSSRGREVGDRCLKPARHAPMQGS